MKTAAVEPAEPDDRLSANRAGRDLAAWVVLAGVLAFAALAGPFFAGRVYTADDLGGFHLPLRAFYAQQLDRGEPFDWMPQLFCGLYLTGEGQVGVYHPLHQVLYRLFSLPAALGWEYLLPYPLMMVGMWLFLRRRIERSVAAAFGGVLFGFCSFNLLHFVHPNAVAIVAHIPWLLWAIDIVLIDSRCRRVALAMALIALLTGSQLLLGYPQYVWYSLVAEFSYVIFIETAHRYEARLGCDVCVTCQECIGCSVRMWPRVVVAKGIGFLLGGVQLLPSVDAWLHSARQSVDSQFVFWGSLHPLNIFQLVAPYMFADRVVGGNTHEFGMYIGAVPLVLIVWVAVRHADLGHMSRTAWTAIGFALLMLLLAFGEYGFLYRVVTWLPLVGGFRFPCRYLVLFQFAVVIAASMGFMLVLRHGESARTRRTVEKRAYRSKWAAAWHDFEPLWGLVGFSIAVAIAGITVSSQPYMASIPAILAGPVLLAAAAMLVALAVRGYHAALVGLIMMTVLDLGYYGLSYAVYPHNERLADYVAGIAVPPTDAEGRIVASLLKVNEPGVRSGDQIILAGWSRADGYAGLEPKRQLDYRLVPALRAAGVRWVKRGPSTEAIAGLKPNGNRWLEVPDPLPRVRLVTHVQPSKTPAVDIAAIDPETTALCDMPLGLPPSQPGTARIVAERPGRLEIDVDCPSPQLLVVAEGYDRGWHAEVDARPQEVYRVNGDFMGCTVGPGKQRVVLVFQPGSLDRGWVTSGLGLGMLSLCFLGTFRRSKSTPFEDGLP